MKLRKLQLENFRNYKKYLFEFALEKKMTILVGPNGIGKTNFLEAIYVLSLGKSFRSLTQENLIKWDYDFMRLTGEVIIDDDDSNLEVFYSNHPKKQKNFKKNGVNLKNSEYLGHLLTVLFQPEDLNMLYLSPQLRRRYLDIILSQTDRKYLNALLKYKKVLKQRNALLSEIKAAQFEGKNIDHLMEDLSAWDRELIQFGSLLMVKRLELIDFLERNVENIYRTISGGQENIIVEYSSKILKKTFGKNIEELYQNELFNRQKRDIFSTETTAGPHRDDLIFFLDGKEISKFASRGEVRTLLLSLKLGEIKYIKEKTGKNPVLLLDDVFSELDRKRQKHLLQSIKDCQTIITTTDIANLGEFRKKESDSTIVKIE